MAFGADKPFVMKIAYAIFPPSLRFAPAGLAAQKIVRNLSPLGGTGYAFSLSLRSQLSNTVVLFLMRNALAVLQYK